MKFLSPFLLLTFLLAGALSPAVMAAQNDLVVGDFAASNLTGWKEKAFKGKTRYRLVDSDVGTVLKAESVASASGLFKEMKIDLTKTPCLTWSWKVEDVLKGLDETTKKGDDYSARVYVVFSGGAFFWKTRALNYVWSGGRPMGSNWPNAFTERSINIAVRSGASKAGLWIEQSRNIRDDYKRFVGEDIKQADAIAIMTDTDNSGRSATAYYGDIRLSPSC